MDWFDTTSSTLDLLQSNVDELEEMVKEIAEEMKSANPDDKSYISRLLTRAVSIYASVSEMVAKSQSLYRIEKDKAFIAAKSTPVARGAKTGFPSDKEADKRATLQVEHLYTLKTRYDHLFLAIQEIVNSLKKILSINGGIVA